MSEPGTIFGNSIAMKVPTVFGFSKEDGISKFPTQMDIQGKDTLHIINKQAFKYNLWIYRFNIKGIHFQRL